MRNFAEVKSRQVPSRKEISGWRLCPIFLLPDSLRPAGTPGPRRVPTEDVLSTALGFALPPVGGGPARPGHSPPPRREVGWGPFLEVLQQAQGGAARHSEAS